MTPDSTIVAEVCDGVRAVTARQVGGELDDVPADATFFDLGADSLLLVGIARDLERQYGVKIAMRELFSAGDTPRRLAELIAARVDPAALSPAPDSAPSQSAKAAVPPKSSVTAPQPEAPPQQVTPPAGWTAPAPPPPVAMPMPDPHADNNNVIAAQAQLLAQWAQLIAQQLNTSGSQLPQPPPHVPAFPPPSADGHPDATPTPAPVSAPAATGTVAVQDIPSPPAADPGPRPTVGANREVPDFSVYFFGDYPQDGEADDKYQLIVDTTRFADSQGFHAAWLPERHFHSFGGLFPNPAVLAAALARETKQIRLHAGSVVLPLHHPIRVAEEWSVVDNLSGGRAGMCVASGWHANDFAFFPERFGSHRELMYQQLEEVKQLWRGESVPAMSGTGDKIDVRLYPKPVQDMPPLYTAVVGNPDSYRMAAHNDMGIVTNLMAQSVEELAERVALYRETRAAAGLDPAAGRVVVLMHTYIGQDVDQARQEAFGPFCQYMRASLGLLGQAANSLGIPGDIKDASEDDIEFILERAYERYCQSRALIGTAESCEPIVDEIIAAGVDEIAYFVDFGVPADLVRRGFDGLTELRDRVATRDKQRTGPLSYSQERFLMLERIFPDRSIYNEIKAVRLAGDLDVDALRAGLRAVVERHGALRTVLRGDEDEPRQVVLADGTVDFAVEEHHAEDEAAVVAGVVAQESQHRFDLAAGPLLRVRVLRTASDRHVLVINAHHAVIDTVSAYVFAADLSTAYRTALGGETPRLPTAERDYVDYARDQRGRADSPESLASLEFWRTHLDGEVPPLRLPTDRNRPAVLNPDGEGVFCHLSPELSRRLIEYSRERRTTMFMTLLAGFATTLHRLSGQRDFAVGTAFSDRPDGDEELIGALLNTLPLRMDFSSDPSFETVLDRVRDTVMDAYEHGHVPFESILEAVNPVRDPSRAPLFQTLVVYEDNEVFDFDFPNVESTVLDEGPRRALYDLTVYLANLPDGVRVHLEYNVALFDTATVRRFATVLENVLAEAVNDSTRAVSLLDCLSDAERVQLSDWETGPVVAVEDHAAHHLVEGHARQRPDDVAVEAENEQLSYAELDSRATALAHRLVACGVTGGDVVAVRLERGAGLVVAQLAIAKAGGAFLTLDPELPDARAAFMTRDAGCAVVIADRDTLGFDAAHVVNIAGTHDAPEISPKVDGDDAAFVVYTSGSTGTPKGVVTGHRALLNVCDWYASQTGLAPGQRTTSTAALGFDVCVLEIWAAMTSGATLVLPGEVTRRGSGELTDWLTARRVDVAWLSTPLAEAVLEEPAAGRLPAHTVVTAGSALRRRPRPGMPFRLVNAYGPAEAGILATHATIADSGKDFIPIGRPISNISVHVLDAKHHRCPIGVVGELYISGIGLASGYLNRPELTAERFATVTLEDGDTRRMYRTGDLARWNNDGQLEYLGRNDDQVKIRGYRIEPGEVAHALRELDEVRDAAVVAVSASDDATWELVAYVVADTDEPPEGTALTAALAGKLPDYMIPRRFAFLPRLPMTANGKLDRAALPSGEVATTATTPQTDTQHRLHQLWCAELGLPRVGIEDSFFDLGGDSLGATRLLNRIRAELECDYPLLDFFTAPTIVGVARRLEPVGSVGTDRVRGII